MEHILVVRGAGGARNEVIASPNEFKVAVRFDQGQVGNLILNAHGIVWCPGQISEGNGRKITWDDFRKFMATQRESA